jgi:hypothetical protein
VEFPSNDKLEGATWDIKFADAAWNGIFATATSPVAVKVNNHALDADDVELTATGLALSNVDIDNDDNTVVFTWTTGAGTTTPPTTPSADIWSQEAVAGVPNWALGAIAVIVVIAAVAIWKNEKK